MKFLPNFWLSTIKTDVLDWKPDTMSAGCINVHVSVNRDMGQDLAMLATILVFNVNKYLS